MGAPTRSPLSQRQRGSKNRRRPRRLCLSTAVSGPLARGARRTAADPACLTQRRRLGRAENRAGSFDSARQLAPLRMTEGGDRRRASLRMTGQKARTPALLRATAAKARGNNGERSCHHCHPRAHVPGAVANAVRLRPEHCHSRAVLAARQLARPACRDRGAQAGQRERNPTAKAVSIPAAMQWPRAGVTSRSRTPHLCHSRARCAFFFPSPLGGRGKGEGGRWGHLVPLGASPPLPSTPLARCVPPLLDPLPRWGRGIRKRGCATRLPAAMQRPGAREGLRGPARGARSSFPLPLPRRGRGRETAARLPGPQARPRGGVELEADGTTLPGVTVRRSPRPRA